MSRSPSILLLLLTLLAPPVHAQGSTASVNPPILKRTAVPGETFEATVEIANPEDVPLSVTIYPQDWSFDPDGRLAFDPVGTIERSASSWITYQPSRFDLDPGERTDVAYSVTVPPDTDPGSYWTVLFVEGAPDDGSVGGAAFRVRLGHVLFVDVPPLTESGSISAVFGGPVVEGGAPAFEFAVQYANTGNATQTIRGSIEIRPIDGDGSPLRIPIDGITVLPDSDRLIARRIVGPLPAGPYLALVVLNYGDPDVDVAAEYFFTLEEDLPDPNGAERGPRTGSGDPS